MAKLSARGRTELFRMGGTRDGRESQYVFLSDGVTLYKWRRPGAQWSRWLTCILPLPQADLEQRLIALGYARLKGKG